MKRVVALLLIFAMLAPSVFILSVNTAKADDPTGDTLYWDDFKSEILQLSIPTQYTSQLISIFEEIEDYWDNPNFNVWVMKDPYGNISLLSLYRTNGTAFCGSGWHNPDEYQLTSGTFPSYFREESYFIYANGVFRYVFNSGVNISNPSARRSVIDLETTGNPEVLYCTPFEFNVSGWKCFSLRTMVSGNANGYTMPSNIVEGSAPPVYLEYNVSTFYLGDRLYFTFKEQDIFREIEPDHLNYTLVIEHDNIDEPIIYTWDNVILLPNAQNFLDIGLSNVSPSGVYAIDITNSNWIVIDVAILVEYDTDNNAETVGYALNTPYRIGDENVEPGTNGTPDSYTEIWNNWNTFITNYPNSPIVPQELVPQFYNTQASSCKPCEVAIPDSLWNARHSVTSFGQDIFEYHFPLVTSPIYNYDLFDVCVLSRQGIITGNILDWDYTLLWWYSDSSTPKSSKIQDLNFDVLMEMFDVIIVVDDPDLVLMDTKNADVVYTGDYEYGFTYSENGFTQDAVLYGFAFVTEKAVQKQILFNFNDGIRKTYDLMSQYVQKRDLWDQSFFSWTTTLFYQLQTLDGSLGKIYQLLFDLKLNDYFQSVLDKLDQLVHNTDEQVHDFWILPLYNFVQTFVPSLTGFSNWIGAIEDFGEGMPEIPAITVPALPTISPTPPLIT